MTSPGNTISPSHQGPAVDIACWICYLFSALCVISKIWMKMSRGKKGAKFYQLHLDDFLLILTLSFATIFNVLLSQQVAFGMGSPFFDLTLDSQVRVEKLGYTSQFMYVCTIGSANMAAIVCGIMLEPTKRYLRLLMAVCFLNITWILSAIFSIAFQCTLPNPWDSLGSRCIDLIALWSSIEILNTCMNCALIAVMCAILAQLQMSKKKYLLMSLLSVRVILVVPVAFKIHFLLQHHVPSAEYPITGNWKITICSALIATSTIVATCLPFLVPVIKNLHSGFTVGDVQDKFGVSDVDETGTAGSSHFQILQIRSFHLSNSQDS
ncbi:hypothetical protein BU24DRAFT_456404 [Aaosphaeria arxii CBS 175.79]|uniref:Rhodopsin domain-containing protein n=1 Tax=Aaosphaeria arxii CBS 175.79 TaxID=1450172 RepID=A0A6A5X5W3_9PLEO|nr:uncharacterized protein BU24DRAFT_456404 [Aaosphaeria arxii CBS 175.79]KAF2008286.1 hypothetical protein BU24DRAFT_456404 [Aaosphaeria arxii CBS 175.79]